MQEVAIQQTLNRYSEGVSRGDWPQVLSTYVPDGVWEVPGLGTSFVGHDAIRDFSVKFLADMDYFVQLNSPGLISVDGDTATARSVIRECGKYVGRDEAMEALGIYRDRLVNTPEGWKFSLRVFELQGMHRFPLLPAGRR